MQVISSWFAIYFEEDRIWLSGVDDTYPWDVRVSPNPWEARRFLTAGDAAELLPRLSTRARIKHVSMQMEAA